MKVMQGLINGWQNATFGDCRERRLSILEHLKRELLELEEVFVKDEEIDAAILSDIKSEMADCQILLFGLASSLDIDMEEETLNKMNTNFARKWKAPDEDGVIEHVK